MRLSAQTSDENAHCVTVRTRGELLPADDETGSRWLEYEVTSPTPRSNRRSGPCLLADIPDDAVEAVVIPPTTYQQVRDEATGRADNWLRRWLMRHNPRPFVGFVHVAARYAIPVAALSGLGAQFLGWATTFTILAGLVLVPVGVLAVLFATGFLYRRPVRAWVCSCAITYKLLALPLRKPVRASKNQARQSVPLALAKRQPPRVWTGATARSMSAGRVVNATDVRSTITHAWRQFAIRHAWRQFVTWFPMLRRQR